MSVSLQNCASGVFVLKYPPSMGAEALGDIYSMVKEQLGNRILVPVLNSCSLAQIPGVPHNEQSTYVMTFPYEGVEIGVVNELYRTARETLGRGKLICIPDCMAIQHASKRMLLETKAVIETRLKEIAKEERRERSTIIDLL